jgi:uncharacterized protein (DUF433 family)/predicted transcriptional regulator
MTETIVRDGATGRAIVDSTGTPVDDILQALQDGGAFDAALRRFPELTHEAVAAALQFARVAVGREIQYLPNPNLNSDRGFTGVRERAVSAYNSGASGGTITVNAREYDALLSRLDLLEGVLEAEQELDDGLGIPHGDVFATARTRASSGFAEDSGSIEDALKSTAEKRDQLRYELDIIESIHAGLEDVAAGRLISHEEAVAFLRAKIPG